MTSPVFIDTSWYRYMLSDVHLTQSNKVHNIDRKLKGH